MVGAGTLRSANHRRGARTVPASNPPKQKRADKSGSGRAVIRAADATRGNAIQGDGEFSLRTADPHGLDAPRLQEMLNITTPVSDGFSVEFEVGQLMFIAEFLLESPR
jgi:hypothetical protein